MTGILLLKPATDLPRSVMKSVAGQFHADMHTEAVCGEQLFFSGWLISHMAGLPYCLFAGECWLAGMNGRK